MIRFGLFGVGFIGSVHANNIVANPRTALGAIYDPDMDRARAAADRSGAHVATGVDDLLAQPVDAVIIASSTSAHAEQLIRSAKAGKAVLCEKPIQTRRARHGRPCVLLSLPAFRTHWVSIAATPASTPC